MINGITWQDSLLLELPCSQQLKQEHMTYQGNPFYLCSLFLSHPFGIFNVSVYQKKTLSNRAQTGKKYKIYMICRSVMIACLIAILISFILFEADNPESSFVFLAETVALVAFGVSWLPKGGTLYPDRKTYIKAGEISFLFCVYSILKYSLLWSKLVKFMG